MRHRAGARFSRADLHDRLLLECGAEHLHALGPRALAEFLAAIGGAHGIGSAILAELNTWRRLTPELVRVALPRRQFPPRLWLAADHRGGRP